MMFFDVVEKGALLLESNAWKARLRHDVGGTQRTISTSGKSLAPARASRHNRDKHLCIMRRAEEAGRNRERPRCGCMQQQQQSQQKQFRTRQREKQATTESKVRVIDDAGEEEKLGKLAAALPGKAKNVGIQPRKKSYTGVAEQVLLNKLVFLSLETADESAEVRRQPQVQWSQPRARGLRRCVLGSSGD